MSLRRFKPTDAELEILQIVWQSGPTTVREVFEQLCKRKDMVYTTVLKLMQIMTDKGLLKRDTTSRQHIYQANVTEHAVQKSALQKIIATAFRGSSSGLILQALGQHKPSTEELQEIKALIDNMEKDENQ